MQPLLTKVANKATYHLGSDSHEVPGMRLKDWLADRRMTGSDFAALIGVDKSVVSRWINGHGRPGWDVIRQITDATSGQVTANDFVGSASDDDDDAAGALGPDDAEPAAEHNGRAA